MINISLDDITGKGKSLYKMAILAGKRAEEISQGAGPLVKTQINEKATTTALKEILANKIEYKKSKKTK